jgi:hypothetical protein
MINKQSDQQGTARGSAPAMRNAPAAEAVGRAARSRVAGFMVALFTAITASSAGVAAFGPSGMRGPLSPPPCLPPPTGMVAWYPLDEPAGATVVHDIAPPPSSLVDNLGVSQPGPVGPNNGPVPVVGQVAGAHYFYSTRLHAVAPQAELDFGTGDFSVDAWIRDVGNGQKQAVVDKLDIPGGNVGFALYFEGWLLKLNLNGATFASTTAITHGDPLGNTGPWYHVAATVARSSGVGVLYINGVPAGPVFVPPGTSVTNALPLWIGATRLQPSPGEIAIDELEIFNRALAASEVNDLYMAGPSGKCKPPRSDLGDAPDSTNHSGTIVPTYATGHFPTVFDPALPGPIGPRHQDAMALLWLGQGVSFEGEADMVPDQDPTTNLLPGASPPSADHDLFDDGVSAVSLPDCAVTQFPISASNAAATTTQGYVNVWFDWTRDGDWDDVPRCAVAPNIDAMAPEWAVQNEAVSLAPGYNPSLPLTPFRSVNPLGGQPTWMRVTLTDMPINGANHGGPFPNPADLGRGGSGPAGGYRYGETEDYFLNVQAGRLFLPLVLRAAASVPVPPSVSTATPTVVPTMAGVATASPTATTATSTATPTTTATTTPFPTPTFEPSATSTLGTPPTTPTPTRTHGPPTATPTPAPGCAPRPAGMAAWWPLDELSGTTAVDVVGAHGGSVQGGAAVDNPAMVLAGRAFDGASGHVVVADDPALNAGAGDLSMDAWIRPRAVDGRRPIVAKTYAPADRPLGYALTLENGQLTLSVSNETSSVVGTAPGTVPVDGQWHLVAVTLQRGSAAGGRVYVDGALVHTFDATPLVGPVDTAAELWIGGVTALGRGTPARFFAGGIDEVEVFHRSLTADEVGAIFTAGAFGKCGKPRAGAWVVR